MQDDANVNFIPPSAFPTFKGLTGGIFHSTITDYRTQEESQATRALRLVLLDLEVVIVSFLSCSSCLVVCDDTLEGMVTSLCLLGDDTSRTRTWVGGLGLVLEGSLTAWSPTLGLAAGVNLHVVEGAFA